MKDEDRYLTLPYEDADIALLKAGIDPGVV